LLESFIEKTNILFQDMQKEPCLLEENSSGGKLTVTLSKNHQIIVHNTSVERNGDWKNNSSSLIITFRTD
jgi:hypothetical protein